MRTHSRTLGSPLGRAVRIVLAEKGLFVMGHQPEKPW